MVSRRTVRFLLVGVAVSLASVAVARLDLLRPGAQLALVDLAEPIVLFMCVTMMLWVVLQFRRGEPPRRQWMPICMGLLVFAFGDLIYALEEFSTHATPSSPGIADVAYALFYPLVAVGIVRAAVAYRRLVRLGPLIAVSAAAGVAMLVLTWAPFTRVALPVIAAKPVSATVSLLFPAADVIFVVVPALLVLLIALRMRGARLALPWIPVALGGVVFAAADVWFLYLQWAGVYEGGHVTDAGWMVGAVLIATGASLAADVNLGTVRRRLPAMELEPADPPIPASPTA